MHKLFDLSRGKVLRHPGGCPATGKAQPSRSPALLIFTRYFGNARSVQCVIHSGFDDGAFTRTTVA